MKYKLFPFYFVFSLLVMINLQCIKRQVDCTGNCNPMQVLGVVINRLTGEAIAGVPYQLTWAASHITNDALLGKYIFKGVSGNNGNILFTTTIDTTRFSSEVLSVRMLDNDRFMMDNVNTESLFLNTYSPIGFQSMVLGVYPQANLVLHLEKTQALHGPIYWSSINMITVEFSRHITPTFPVSLHLRM